MATNPLLLGIASNSSLNFQIPSISIKLNRDNYSLWRSTIISALETFELEAFVLAPAPPAETITVSPTEGPPTTQANPEFTLWKKRDRFVLLWLKSTLSERSLAIVARCSSSSQAWTAIERTYQAQTKARRMSMKQDLQTLSKGSLSMIEYVEKKRTIADSLAENLHPISNEDLIGHILSGLDSSYGPFITAFMVKDADSTIDDLVGMLLQEEARLEHEILRQSVTAPTASPSPNSSTSLALNVNRSPAKPGSSNSTTSFTGSRTPEARRRRPQCQLCSKPGHEAVDCWQRTNQTDYPSRKPNPRNPPRQAHFTQSSSPSTVVDPNWYFDSGATDHITTGVQNVNVADEYTGADRVQVGNGTTSASRGR